MVGSVEEFCPFHRAIHEFDVVANKTRAHVYGIIFGKGDLLGHMIRRVDRSCYLVKSIDREEYETRDPSVEWASRLELERQLALDPAAVDVGVRRYVANDVVTTADQAYAEGSSDQILRHRLRWYRRAWQMALVLVVAVAPGLNIDTPIALTIATLFGGLVAMWAIKRLLRSLHREAIAVVTDEIVRSLKLDPVAEIQVLDGAKRAGFTLADNMLTQRLRRA